VTRSRDEYVDASVSVHRVVFFIESDRPDDFVIDNDHRCVVCFNELFDDIIL